MIQSNQQLIQYFHRQTKLQQFSPYSLNGSRQQIHLVIRKQESMSSEVVGLCKKYLWLSLLFYKIDC